jgi:hypothetical protein
VLEVGKRIAGRDHDYSHIGVGYAWAQQQGTALADPDHGGIVGAILDHIPDQDL